MPGGPAAALDLADLATIGTVADVAPVVGENRAIARLGLERLRRAPRPGIAALLERARIAPAAVDLETVSFALAPRLNAAGRVGEALEAARLLLADDPAEAARPRRRPRGRQPDAPRPDEDGRRRGAGRRSPTTPADAGRRSSAARGPSASSGWSRPGWPRTAVGRPSSAPSSATSSGRRAGATDRSTSGAALERCADLFIRFGGHAGAAGFELAGRPLGRVPRPVPGRLAAERRRATRALALAIDLALPALDVDYALFRELAGLAPCGPGNPTRSSRSSA